MDILFKSLGEYLRKHRAQKGLTQGEVAHALGYSSPQFISNFERGLCAPPFHKLSALVRVLRLDSEEMVHLIVSSYEKEIRKHLKGARR